jgi:hypothetical protein
MKALALCAEYSDHSGFKILRVYDVADRGLIEKDKEMLEKVTDMNITIRDTEIEGNL